MGSTAATTLDTLQPTLLLFPKQGHCCGSIFPLARYKFFSRVWETWFGKNRMCSSTTNIECGVPCTINSYGLVISIISTGLLHHYHHYIWIYLIVSSRKMLVHWQIGLQNQYMGRISRLHRNDKHHIVSVCPQMVNRKEMMYSRWNIDSCPRDSRQSRVSPFVDPSKLVIFGILSIRVGHCSSTIIQNESSLIITL